MRVTFIIPTGAGGFAQGYANGQFYRMIHWWMEHYENCFTVTKEGLKRHCDFTDKVKFQLFLDTFRPQQEYWWKTAIIDRSENV